MSIIREALREDILERYDNEEYWDKDLARSVAEDSVIHLSFDEFTAETVDMCDYELYVLKTLIEDKIDYMENGNRDKADLTKKLNYLKEIM